jgi:murein DD-endopeptidase MepM/ murein hydrolase activator NlpD
MARGFNPLLKFKQLGTLTTPWGAKTEQEPFHFGIDIANVAGTPIPAPTQGVVTKVVTGIPHGANSFGNSIEIKDPQGNTQQYHHLQDALVQPGQQVQQGQEIGKIGDSGATYSPSNSSSANLDMRIVTAFGKYRNPLTYLKQVSKNNYGK